MPDGDPLPRPSLRLAFRAEPVPFGESRALRTLRQLDDEILREYGLESDAAWGMERLAEREAAPVLDLVGEPIEVTAA